MGRLRYNRFKKFRQPAGEVWTRQPSLQATAWSTSWVNALTWNGSVFVAGGANGNIATSPDGVTWTYQPSLRATAWSTNTVSALAWNGSVFVAGGANGNIAISKEDF